MPQDDKKKAAAYAALEYVEQDSIVGVGTGSTVNHFIDALATIKNDIEGAVSSSEASRRAGLPSRPIRVAHSRQRLPRVG